MTVQGYITRVRGTPITWTNTGGTKVLNGKNLATAGIQAGEKSASLIDGTKGMPVALEITIEAKYASGPTAGNPGNLYLGWSSSATTGTDNPAGLSGSSGSVSSTDVLTQLDGPFPMVSSNSLGTGVQRTVYEIPPKKEYVIPVFQNSSGQSTSNADGETVITITPWYLAYQT